jgi:serine protease Do
MYQITAPISLGNSGGPIVSGLDGSVLGINSVKYKAEDIDLSIPIYTVLSTFKKWSDNPMNLSDYEENYEFEVPEYDGDITDYFEEDYEEEEDEGYDTDTGLDIEEEYPEEKPYDEERYHYVLTSDVAAATVFAYYNNVNAGYYKDAYNLIGGNWKTSSPSSRFCGIYANT